MEQISKGLQLQKNNNGFWVIFCHYTADPDKDPEANGKEWYEKARRGMHEEQWQQEYEINFYARLGKRVFPEFEREIHVRDVLFRDSAPLYLGWDFGWHHPAVIFAQIDDQDRLLVLDEIIGESINLYKFIEKAVYPKLNSYGIEIRNKKINHHIISCCDPQGVQRTDAAESSSIEILRSYGFLNVQYSKRSIQYGLDILRKLLLIRPDGTPAFYISPKCTNLIEGFVGGYHYPENNAEIPEKDGFYEHLFDALRYLIVRKFKPIEVKKQIKPYYVVNRNSPTGY